MSTALRTRCGALLGAWLFAGAARAHPSPAEPPEFFPADCIIVVDKQQHASWHLDYAVVVDDTAPEVDHISLPDSKTHQFFALAGTLHEGANGHMFLRFDDEAGLWKPMPTWLTAQEVTRAAASVSAEDMTAFAADQVSEQDILERDPELSSALLPLVAGTSRVPITGAQASAGVDWDLRDVPPGAYQIAAYIFSPPYNGWAVRPGLIKVIDGADDAQAPAAITLQPVAARLFAGQGRRVRGCVDAPAGSTLELSTRAQAEGHAAFEPWATEPVTNGTFELCFDNAGLDEALELRIEVHTPSGRSAATQSSDVVALFSNEAACVPSELLCCPAGSNVDASVALEDASTPMMPMRPGAIVDAGPSGEGEPLPRDGSLEAGVEPSQPTADAAAQSTSCAVAADSYESNAWLALWVVALFVRRSSRDRPR